ncbi:hypothetical protein HN51_042262 [Arachis hypogaea]|uniref:Uncharacterized protein n=2 Tax=Arachis TaxID=3817 RepID=A0A444YW07_ARAHY|nr:protein SOB FIVE-LIKE 5-like [Arachis duranensis]XP_025606835.1 uncharacterized protein LOC112697738 [Arachis hypogaea]QHN88162.1 uncharacterized protein DS421_16g561240 [Arachis hypogaea]RYR06119.1 hypothetical protein Ahy_B06g085912 [Arachis hypogaea]
MDISASQYNSASESGWTHYLDQSSSLVSESYFQRIDEFEGKGAGRIMEEEEFEEDLSMVSDASSGPPHYDNASSWYCENNWYANNNNNTKESQKKKKKMMVKEFGRSQQQQQQSSYLDDTASSPIFNFPKESHKKSFSGNGAVEDALDFSQCLSVTRIKRKPKFQNLFRGKQASEEQGGFDEEGRK